MHRLRSASLFHPASLLLLLGALVGCGGGGAAPPNGDGPPPAAQYVVWRYSRKVARPPTLAFQTPPNPGKGATVADPVYHTTIRRVTDRVQDGYASPAVVNEYARIDPENADGTRALLRGVDGAWYLYETATWRLLREVGFRGNPDPEPRWDGADPALVYFVEGPCLWRYNVATDQTALVHDFRDEDPRCAIVRTRFEGEPSADSRYWCLRLEDADFRLLRVICYDKQPDRVVGRLTTGLGDWDWTGMDLSGTHCLLGAGDVSGAYSYHRDFSHLVRLPRGMGHGDVALTAAGRDVMVYQNASTDWIAMVDLETGVETNLLPIPFDDNLDIGLHVSGNSDRRPGWVLVSTYGQQRTAKSWMDQCLFMVQLQARPLVWRVAQTFCIQDPALEKDYFGEAFAALNRAGTRIWWGSNWSVTGAGNHQYETYVADLPADWEARVAAAE